MSIFKRRNEPEPLNTLDLVAAHKHCIWHRAEIEASVVCGCFYCGSMFTLLDITEWTDEGQTVLGPRCQIDAVLGLASGFPITPEFLQRMHVRWF